MALQADDGSLTFDRRRLFEASALAAVLAACGADDAAAAPLADPMRPMPIPPQRPAREGIAALDDTNLFYWDTGGGGAPIVLMHPASGSALTWPYQQPAFAKKGYRVIAYSRRGYYNSSPVPDTNPGTASGDLHRLTGFLGIDRFHLVASAGGCAFANDYALSHPDKVRSLVLSSGLGGVQDPDYLATLAALTPKGYDQMPVDFRELGPSYRAANPDGAKEWLDRANRAITGKRRGQTMANVINWAKLAELKPPVLLLTGDADLNCPPAIMRMFAARIPHSQIRLIAEAGHSAYWEQPELFNRIVLDFIARH